MLEGHAVLSDHVYFPFQDQRGHAGLQIYCVCVCSNKVILITDVHKCIIMGSFRHPSGPLRLVRHY